MSATKQKTAQSPLFDDPSPEAVEMKPVLLNLVPEALNKAYSTKISELPTYQAVRQQDAAYQGRLALALATAMSRCTPQDDYRTRYTLGELLGALLRGTLGLNEADYLRLFNLYYTDGKIDTEMHYWNFPVGLTLAQVARLRKKKGLGQPMQSLLREMLAQLAHQTTSEAAKLRRKMLEILNQEAGSGVLPIVQFTEGDPLGRALAGFVAKLDPQAASSLPWLHLLESWQEATTAVPTAKLRQKLETATAAIGPEAVRAQCREWLELLLATPVVEVIETYHYADGQTRDYAAWPFLQEPNAIVAKGLAWTVQPLADAPLLHLLANLAVKCYDKVPGRGPLAAGLGNACLLALSHNGLPGVSALARVRARIKQTNTQTLIAGYIEQASQALGVTPAEIEDMAVPDFDLADGRHVLLFGDYTATLTLADGKADVAWTKAGNPLKAAPAALKATHAQELKDLKATHSQVQQTYTAQRERLDRGFVEERRMPWPWFAQYYFTHGLLSTLARPLIWRLHRPDGTHHDALWLDDQWQDAHGQPVPAPTDDTQVQLWHPVLVPPAQVLAWRTRLDRAHLRQPLKQAYREVYLLTPPEERTRTYSNRMAAHLLKQHQFNALAKLRGWKYRLLGAYDKGYESETATLALQTHQLQAEFLVNEVAADDAFNESGIWLYVSTDHVRFTRAETAVPLPEVPPVVLSEVLRDVDLFVGVASVGNDPLWRDNGGLPAYRPYWESYSFGELTEVAKTRRLALERLVPRLKIGKVSTLTDRFLVVQGKRRTYKIHLGSGNILMEPNDQYLCIVPDRSAKTLTASADVFLPFEGDAVLSIILSKALLLMDEDKITDQTILRQIDQAG